MTDIVFKVSKQNIIFFMILTKFNVLEDIGRTPLPPRGGNLDLFLFLYPGAFENSSRSPSSDAVGRTTGA